MRELVVPYKGMREQKGCKLAQIIPYYARLHAALRDSRSHVSTGLSPFIPSSHLTKGWRSVFLTEWVRALLRNVSRYSVLLIHPANTSTGEETVLKLLEEILL